MQHVEEREAEDLVERVVAREQARCARHPVPDPVRDARRNHRGGDDHREPRQAEFGGCARDVDAVRDEDHAFDAVRLEDRRGEGGVLVRVARARLEPSHRHAVFVHERIAHQQRFRGPAAGGAARHQHRQRGRSRDARAVADALERQRGERRAAVFGRVLP